MFRPGDIVVVKVMSVVLNDEGKHRVSLSLNPSDIHYNYMATDLVENIVRTNFTTLKSFFLMLKLLFLFVGDDWSCQK